MNKAWLLLAALPLLMLRTAIAQPVARAAEPAAIAPKVSLVTFAPGAVYWETYGHNALLVRDGVHPPLLFNYGVFDFHQKNFFLNFARGKMRYRLVVEPLDETLPWYQAEGRWAREQPLNLTPAEATELYDYLMWNVQPDNAEYYYDYFINNCSTRVRDAIDQVLHGQLKRRMEQWPADRDYRDEAVRHMASEPALALGMDLVLGRRSDESMTVWQQSFLPLTLMVTLDHIKLDDGRPLVTADLPLLHGGEAPVMEHAPELLWLTLLVGAALTTLLLLPNPRYIPWVAVPVNLLSGLGGLILLLIWTLTDHWAMHQNYNLLLFSPLSLLLIPASAGRGGSGKFSSWLAVLIALGALLALALPWLPHAQANLPWVALWLPVHAAMAWHLRKNQS